MWEGRLGVTKLEVGTKIEANYKALGKYYPGKVRESITACIIITITTITIPSSIHHRHHYHHYHHHRTPAKYL